ncbi:hypothetical protein BDB00DRAFT_641399 [Zychaea mexicana]|uniref:uncharacterized protein n=1 Tax=Zychaea mexicana TaxID=64656 RepID=UPI0022FE9417|nr:uncharacterized protein BDB00DRAFT_641399 [Zychaea mexicana]KAI9489063.1 hypothetical protein BDB00DRAFT_641399 [Zychaea mexicana]
MAPNTRQHSAKSASKDSSIGVLHDNDKSVKKRASAYGIQAEDSETEKLQLTATQDASVKYSPAQVEGVQAVSIVSLGEVSGCQNKISPTSITEAALATTKTRLCRQGSVIESGSVLDDSEEQETSGASSGTNDVASERDEQETDEESGICTKDDAGSSWEESVSEATDSEDDSVSNWESGTESNTDDSKGEHSEDSHEHAVKRSAKSRDKSKKMAKSQPVTNFSDRIRRVLRSKRIQNNYRSHDGSRYQRSTGISTRPNNHSDAAQSDSENGSESEWESDSSSSSLDSDDSDDETTPLRQRASTSNSSAENATASPKQDRFYCPYRGCALSRNRQNLLNTHMREEHFPGLVHMRGSRFRRNIFKTTWGQVIPFDESSCDLLEDGEEMVVESNVSSEFHCPYKGCIATFTKLLSTYYHMRTTHKAIIPRLNNSGECEHVFKNPSGQVINFDESSRNMLSDEDTVSIERFMKGVADDRAYYCCPYKGCIYKSNKRKLTHLHIRKRHDESFKVKTSSSLTLKAPSGREIHLDETSKDLISESEQIVVYRRKSRKGPFYCPYKSCDYTSSKRLTLYLHIREYHDETFAHGGYNSYLDPSRKRITFDEDSKNSIDENECIK